MNPFNNLSLSQNNVNQYQNQIANKMNIQSSDTQGFVKCPSHPEEDAKYFCFSCLIPPICSECVIHGIHKTHEVFNVKQALPIVQNKLEGYIPSLKIKEAQVNSSIYSQKSKMKEMNNLCQVYKENIKSMFDELRQKIDKKENELRTFGDNSIEQNLNEIKDSEKNLTSRVLSIQGNCNSIKEKMNSKNMNEILCFYAENSNKINQLFQSNKYEDLISSNGTKNIINTELVCRVRSQISQICFKIDNFQIHKSKANDHSSKYDRSTKKEIAKSVTQIKHSFKEKSIDFSPKKY